MPTFAEYKAAIHALTFEALSKKIQKETDEAPLDMLFQHVRDLLAQQDGMIRVGHMGKRELERLASLCLQRSRSLVSIQTRAVIRRQEATYAAQDQEANHDEERTHSAPTYRTGRGRSQRLDLDE